MATAAGVIMIFGAGPVLGLFALIAIPTKFHHNVKKNERMINTVAEWQRQGKLATDHPFCAEEDKLLRQMVSFMVEIDKAHKHPAVTGGLLVGSMAYGAYEVGKVPGQVGRGLHDAAEAWKNS